MSSEHVTVAGAVPYSKPVEPCSLMDEKTFKEEDRSHVEHIVSADHNMAYEDDEKEPELHARTYVALAAMFFMNMTHTVTLQGPPAVLSYMGQDLNDTVRQTWVVNALALTQSVVAPLLCTASDTFQMRKAFLVGPCIIAFIGAAIAPGSKSVYRLIVCQVLTGIGFSTAPLTYSIPSEILPRKWRSMAQAGINVGAALGACGGPLIIGALTKHNAHTGWRNYFWFEMAMWGITAVSLFFGYNPPQRRTQFDHLTLWQKLGRLDILGSFLLTAGLTLFLTGLNLGGGIFQWSSSQVLVTLIVGIVTLIIFGIYEWKGTKIGILHHNLFLNGKERGRTFTICIGLVFIEGILGFAYVVFFPILSSVLFESDPFLLTARLQAFWLGACCSTGLYGYASTKLRSIRSPMFVSYVLFTAGIAALASIQPSDSTNSIAFAGLAGVGVGGPLALIISGVQLATPHHLIATASAVTTSARAVGVTIFTAIFSATLTTGLTKKIPSYVGAAAIGAGLPTTSMAAFVGALATNDISTLPSIPGVTPSIIRAGFAALKQAYADSLRPVFIIAAPFGVVACIACCFLGDMKSTMNYHVDAPMEELHAKHEISGLV